ncbi:MAG: FAD-dependent oxidoreductase [Bacilli bacterium]|nr:FAD-dependent oxidoreductase [Bacilli bacterium]
MLDILIIGGGPAAMTAALYSLRSGRTVKLIEKEAFGGQIATSPRVENIPSIASISGLEYSNNLFEQISNLGADFDMDEANSIEKMEDGTFKVYCNYGTYEAKTVIIAAGVHHRKLGIENEEKYIGHGISYCAVCDGDFFRGQDVMVIGDANSALQYAISLAATSKHVDVVTLFDHFFAEDALIKRLRSLDNVSIYHNMASYSFNGDTNLKSVSFQNTVTKENVTMECAGCFVAIGQVPDNERYSNLVDLDKGFIVANDDMSTKTEGLFVAGDCRVKQIRQVTTACNDGAIAALSANSYLMKKGY